MECDPVREALSAHLDGEDGGISPEEVTRHVAGCASCRAWNEDLGTLHRIVRVRAADDVPDLSAAIVDAHSPVRPPRRRATGTQSARRPWHAVLTEPISSARWGLFVVALTQLVLAGPALLLGDDAGATVHIARELGSFDVALAIGLLVAAWQPARAWGLFPVSAALGLVMLGTAALDLADGATSVGREAPHILDLAGVLLLWFVARERRAGGLAPRSMARPA